MTDTTARVSETTVSDTADALEYRTLTSVSDPYYDIWLDLYQTSFPLSEQLQISALNRMLRSAESGSIERGYVELGLALAGGRPVGIYLFAIPLPGDFAILSYLAVQSECRSRGRGAEIYREILRRAKVRSSDLRALIYEVEDPNHAEGIESERFAHRRIGFYRRLGGRLVTGVRYLQSVGWQPPIPMHLMIHDLSENGAVTPSNSFELLRSAFGDEVSHIGDIGLI